MVVNSLFHWDDNAELRKEVVSFFRRFLSVVFHVNTFILTTVKLSSSWLIITCIALKRKKSIPLCAKIHAIKFFQLKSLLSIPAES